MTLASQWKSQFDDSEETDDELQGEHLQSPEHLPALARLGVAMLQQQMYGYGSNPSSPVFQQAASNFSNHFNEQVLAVESAAGSDINSSVPNNQRRQHTANGSTTRPYKTSGRYSGENDRADDEEYLLVKGSLLDGLDVEGADTLQIPANRLVKHVSFNLLSRYSLLYTFDQVLY